jgi:hypothetical protein
MSSIYSGKAESQEESREANSNSVPVRDSNNFPNRAGLGDDARSRISLASGVANSTGPTSYSHQPSDVVGRQYQCFDQPNALPNGYVRSHDNSWQQGDASLEQYDGHPQQTHPTDTDIRQAGTSYIDVNGNLAINRTAYLDGSDSDQHDVDWFGGDTQSQDPPQPVPQK